MKFQVTKEHIDAGTPEDPLCCPIAWCLKDYGYPHAGISETKIILDFRSEIASIGTTAKVNAKNLVQTPDSVRRRIKYYDRTGKMKPFSFEMDIPN